MRGPSGLVAVALLTAALPASAERLWLVIGASDSSARAIAEKAGPLDAAVPEGLSIRMGDCMRARSGYAWAVVADTAREARDALARLRPFAADAYIRRCEIAAGSLLALRIDAVDPSVAHVPADAVNWRDADRVSTLQPLDGRRSLLVARHYAPAPGEPREGRRERVSLVGADGLRALLQEDCVDAGKASARGGDVVFQCAREQAADHLLHSVVAFDGAGRKLAEIAHCRNPRWAAQRAIVCEAESVDAHGRLTLRRKRTPVGPAVR